MSELEHILSAQCQLGEGPIWDDEEQVLYWVDILSQNFSRLYPTTGVYETYHVGVSVGVMALRQSGGLIMATKKGIGFWDPDRQEVEYLVEPERERPHLRFNDGAVDCAGRFWVGTIWDGEDFQPEGTLYRFDPDGSLHVMETGIGISNGIGWSPDNTIMYYTDSLRGNIYAYDFDAVNGTISNQRIFVHRSWEEGQPDGLTVDSEGYVWSAIWDGCAIIRYDPHTRKEDRVIEVPVLRPTSCVFGGKELNELYITSARSGTDEQQMQYPLSGDLFRINVGVRGLPTYRFGTPSSIS